MKRLTDAISSWPKAAARNYVAGMSRKRRLDILQIVLIGVPVLIGVVLMLGLRVLGAIGLPGPAGSFAIWVFVGAVVSFAIEERARQLAAPAFLASQPIPEAVVVKARRRLARPALLAVFGIAAVIGLAFWVFAGLGQSGGLFVLPVGVGLLLGALVFEMPFETFKRLGISRDAAHRLAHARSVFSGLYSRLGPVATWWRFHDRRMGDFLPLKLGIVGLVVVVLAVLSTVQQEPWAWPALMWLVAGVILVEELNLSGLGSRIALVQPAGFWRVLRSAAVWPFLIATGVTAALGGVGVIIGALGFGALALNVAIFVGVGLFYLCALALARGNRRAALLIAFACLILIGSVADYLREGTLVVFVGIAAALLMSARRTYLWPSRRT